MHRNELENEGNGETVSQTINILENSSNSKACRVCLVANADTVIYLAVMLRSATLAQRR